MAKVAITFARTGGRTNGGPESVEIVQGNGAISEIITTSNVSKVTATAARDPKDAAIVMARGGAVWVSVGKTPVAVVPADGTVGAGFGLLDGQVLPIALKQGDKIAVIDWAG